MGGVMSEWDKIERSHNEQYDKIDPASPEAMDAYIALFMRTSRKHYMLSVKEGRQPTPLMIAAHKGKNHVH
jgi:hypothetical protein